MYMPYTKDYTLLTGKSMDDHVPWVYCCLAPAWSPH